MATAAKADYYEVLGVDRDADEDTIRKAFHDRAREWHPDIAVGDEAEQRFRDLAEAYTVLSKSESRLLYDRYGYRGRGNQRFDEALLDARPSVERGANVHIAVELKSFEADGGTRRLVRYEALLPCEDCEGRGVLGEADPECRVCGGTGRSRQVADLELARVLHIEACPACGSETCPSCKGSGRALSERRVRLIIPPGVVNGSQLRVSGDGNYAGAGSIPGDLLIDVRVLPEPRDPRAVRYVAFLLLLLALATLAVYLATH
jgi:molecular chaperone DnaJ